MANKALLFTSGAAFAAGIDQVTKHYALIWTAKLPINSFEPLVPNFLDLRYAENVGSAFSLFSGYPLLFFLAVGALAMAFILSFLWKLERHQTGMVLALSFVMGGALGNWIDRVRFRHVTDFLYLHYYQKFDWPIFNFADIFICIGVAVLVYNLMKVEIERAREARKSKAGGQADRGGDAPAD